MEMFDQANQFHLEGKYPEAEDLYDQLLSQNHDNAGLLATMGTLYLKMSKLGLAISFLHRAAQKTPQSDILCNLAIAYKYSGQLDKAHKYFKDAIQHKPSADAMANYAALFTNNGTPDEGIALSKKAIKLDYECAVAHWNLAMALLEKGEWAQGWDEQEWGFKSKMRIDRGVGSYPYWDGTPGQTLWVFGEQGIGDEIMFASMLPDLMRQNTVILECHPRLVTLFKDSFPGLTVYGTRDGTSVDWTQNHEIDARVSIGSLGKWFRRERSAFPGTPYLKSSCAERGSKYRVGISWTGGLKPGRIRARTIPLSWWKSILDVPEVEFVSLQYTDCAEEIAMVNGLGYDIKQFDAVKADDYADTAKLVQSCDLVITIATSVYHLAGALGVPAWVMVPNKPAWREQISGGIPFYRSVRVYRQPAGDADAWIPVVERVGYDLSERMAAQAKQLRAA